MAKVKVFVHATYADADGRAMTLAPGTNLSQLAKKLMVNVKLFPKVGQTANEGQMFQNLWNHQKGIVIRNTHVK